MEDRELALPALGLASLFSRGVGRATTSGAVISPCATSVHKFSWHLLADL
jgi:hypothetical protein